MLCANPDGTRNDLGVAQTADANAGYDRDSFKLLRVGVKSQPT